MNKKKYPKHFFTEELQFGDCDCRQLNVHKGRKFTYWFLEPNEKPFKTPNGIIPEELNEFRQVIKKYE